MKEKKPLVRMFVPALVTLLMRDEELKGSPLTEEEVHRICDGANYLAIPPEHVAVFEEDRSYRDIDDEDCWAEWQRLRAEWEDASDGEPPPA